MIERNLLGETKHAFVRHQHWGEDVTMLQLYLNGIEHLESIAGFRALCHEKLIDGISPGKADRHGKIITKVSTAKKRRYLLHILENASWIDQEDLAARMNGPWYRKHSSRYEQTEPIDASFEHDNDDDFSEAVDALSDNEKDDPKILEEYIDISISRTSGTKRKNENDKTVRRKRKKKQAGAILFEDLGPQNVLGACTFCHCVRRFGLSKVQVIPALGTAGGFQLPRNPDKLISNRQIDVCTEVKYLTPSTYLCLQCQLYR